MKKTSLIILFCLLAIFYWRHRELNKDAQRRSVLLREQYPILTKDAGVEGFITDIRPFDRNNRFTPNFACFTLSDAHNYQVTVSTEVTSGFELMDLLQPQMYLTKWLGNDTLELRLDSADQSPVYRFVLYH